MKLETHSGGYLDYDNPTAEQIDIEDIAHALSMMCRFNGHTKRFYSVAEHALLCHHLRGRVEASYLGVDQLPGMALLVLHHDSHEAYLGDIPTPLKQHMVGWKGVSQRIDRAIAAAFGFDARDFSLPSIKAIDRLALRIEARELKSSRGVGTYWGWDAPPAIPAPWRLGLAPATAKYHFLDLHRRLMEAR
jgi:hypothetical protein